MSSVRDLSKWYARSIAQNLSKENRLELQFYLERTKTAAICEDNDNVQRISSGCPYLARMKRAGTIASERAPLRKGGVVGGENQQVVAMRRNKNECL